MAPDTGKLFVGLYSGPAADGVDAAVVHVRGRRERTKANQVHHLHLPLPPDLPQRVRDLSAGAAEPARAIALLDRDLALLFAHAAHDVLAAAKVDAGDVAAIGSSGQAVCRIAPQSRAQPGATMLLASPAIIAQATALPVVAGFAAADAASGRSLSAWADWVLFRDKRLSRVAVHLGAVASIVFVGAGADARDLSAFDAGPGTLLIDAVTRSLFDRPFDDGGALAAKAAVCQPLLNEMLAAPWFRMTPPKTLSVANWGPAYLDRLTHMAAKHRCNKNDLVATVTELAARSIADAIAGLTERPHQVILSGGGAMNIHLAGRIRNLMSPSSTITVEKFAIPLRAKQAVCHAIAAAATLDALHSRPRTQPTPSTAAPLGTITFPTPHPES